jgi:hypothetical protein
LEEGFDDVKEQLENCSTHANLMNLKTLTNEELYNLSKILYSCSQKGQSAEDCMTELFKHLKPITEDNQAFVWDKIYDVAYTSLR